MCWYHTWENGHQEQSKHCSGKHCYSGIPHCQDSCNEERLVAELGHNDHRYWCQEGVNKTQIDLHKVLLHDSCLWYTGTQGICLYNCVTITTQPQLTIKSSQLAFNKASDNCTSVTKIHFFIFCTSYPVHSVSVPSKFLSVCAEGNGVWAAHFGAWALQLSHFWKRQIKSKTSDGDPEGSAGSAVRFWRPIFGWYRCIWQPKNKRFLDQMFQHLVTFREFLLTSVNLITKCLQVRYRIRCWKRYRYGTVFPAQPEWDTVIFGKLARNRELSVMPQMRLPYRRPISVHFLLNLQFFSKYPAMRPCHPLPLECHGLVDQISWLDHRLQTTSTWDGLQQTECSNREVYVERTNINFVDIS